MADDGEGDAAEDDDGVERQCDENLVPWRHVVVFGSVAGKR